MNRALYNHYANQSGAGIGLPVYRGGVRQGGAGFLSSLKRAALPMLMGLKKTALPVLKTTVKKAAKAALPHAVAGLAEMIDGRSAKEVLKERSRQAGKDALMSTLDQFDDDDDDDGSAGEQTGSGRRVKRVKIKCRKRSKSSNKKSAKKRKLDALDMYK